jgi:hypothetical protein
MPTDTDRVLAVCKKRRDALSQIGRSHPRQNDLLESEALDLFAAASILNCSGRSHLCTCGYVTDIWRRVEPYLRERAEGLGLTKEGLVRIMDAEDDEEKR